MRLSTTMLLLSIASAPMMLWGGWSFKQSLRHPPTTFTQAAGEIAEVHVSTGRLSKSEVRFRLNDDPNFFNYPLFFPRYYFLSERLATGKRVELTHRPEARDEIWSLKLDGEVILDEQLAIAAYRRVGYIALGFAICMGVITLYFIRGWRSFLSRGI